MRRSTSPNQTTADNAGWRVQFRFAGTASWYGVCEFCRSPYRMPRVAVFVSALLILCWSGAAASLLDRESYPVYSAVLRDQFGGRKLDLIVVNSQTTKLNAVLESVRNLKPLDESLRSDFLRVNRISLLLNTNGFSQDLHVVLLTSDQQKQLLASPDGSGWRRFCEQYPRSQGITEFSRVAFNKDRTAALVYAGTQRDGLDGGGFLVVVELVDGVWRV